MELFHRPLLFRAEHAAAGNRFRPVHLMPIKVRAVHAREFRHAANRHAAATPQARAIKLNRDHIHHGLQVLGLGQVAFGFHHLKRADGNHFVVHLACIKLRLKRLRHKALVAV